jgi:phosphoribosyl 1,2-cyclic phosphate phosphodiesterase
MRFVFLGTGTSAGVPAIGCTCDVCTSTDPRDNRLRSGAAICFTDGQGQERVILIDATPDLRQQALRFGITRCDAIVFTHNHVDHVFGLDEVRRFNVVQGGPIDIYCEPSVFESLRRVYKHIFDRDANVNDSFVASIIPRTLRAGEPLDLHGLRLTPVRLMHGRLPIVGFRIEPMPGREYLLSQAADRTSFPLCYCTDVSAIPSESWEHLQGLGTLIIDGLRWRHHPTHMTVQQAVNTIEEVGARRGYLTQIAHDLGHAATEAQLPDHIRLAYDGLVL